MSRTTIWSAIEHICAAADALNDYRDTRAERARGLLDAALNELAPHHDAPPVFRFTEAEVRMRVLKDQGHGRIN